MTAGNQPHRMFEEPWGTCDWGDCNGLSVAWRWSGQSLGVSPLGWLPVCELHARHGRVEWGTATTSTPRPATKTKRSVGKRPTQPRPVKRPTRRK